MPCADAQLTPRSPARPLDLPGEVSSKKYDQKNDDQNCAAAYVHVRLLHVTYPQRG